MSNTYAQLRSSVDRSELHAEEVLKDYLEQCGAPEAEAWDWLLQYGYQPADSYYVSVISRAYDIEGDHWYWHFGRWFCAPEARLPRRLKDMAVIITPKYKSRCEAYEAAVRWLLRYKNTTKAFPEGVSLRDRLKKANDVLSTMQWTDFLQEKANKQRSSRKRN